MTGKYELLERVRARLSFIFPLTLGLVFVILYLNFRGIAQTMIVMLGVPFAAVGAIWLLYFAEFNTSIAVWVGMIALLGVAAETTSVTERDPCRLDRVTVRSGARTVPRGAPRAA
jgi:copper/silver efflux system protein